MIKIDFDSELKCLKSYLKKFPKSGIQDIYKYFLQSFMGPSHFVSNLEDAGLYLLKEYDEVGNNYSYPDIIKLGSNPRYVRISLKIIDKISFEIFLNAFVESTKIEPSLSVKDFLEFWLQFSKYIVSIKIFPKNTVSEFNSKINENNYLVHHSDKYKEIYNPHYRVIFLEKISGILKKIN